MTFNNYSALSIDKALHLILSLYQKSTFCPQTFEELLAIVDHFHC